MSSLEEKILQVTRRDASKKVRASLGLGVVGVNKEEEG